MAEAEKLLKSDETESLVKYRRKQLLNVKSLVKGHGRASIDNRGALQHIEVF